MKTKLLSVVSFLVVFLIVGAQVAEAQYFSFGKNRVQYQEFEWRYIESQHFDVYYYGKKNYELAEFSAKSVESAYQQLKNDFNHEISSRLTLIIYDSHNDFSQTNVVNLPTSAEGIGGVTDKLKNRMTVPFNGDYADFRRTLHHELVHAVFNDMFYGGSLNSIIQNNIQLVFPLWFEEGLAEYMALGWDTNTDMFIRDAVINNFLPDIQFLGGYFAYRGGQSVWNYIEEEYGRPKIAEILGRIKNSRSIEVGFSQSLGLTIEELSENWENALQERYYPEVAERERTDAIATLLTERGAFGTYNTSPSISPQGDKIAFITNSRGYFDVIVISALNGKKLKTLVEGEDNPDFEELNILNPNIAWSPDGTKLSMSTKSKGRDELAFIDYSTKKITKVQLPDLDAISSVAWSPDGDKVAFDGNIGPYQDIFVYDISKKKLTNLTRDLFSDTQPAWSADSKSVYFTSDRGDKIQLGKYGSGYDLLSELSMYQTDIYKVDIESKKATRLTNTPGWNEKGVQSTLDDRLVFISDQNGIQNIYEFDVATRTITPLTNLQTGAIQISMSADGSRLALNSYNEGYLDVFLLKSPLQRAKTKEPSLSYWAKRRNTETPAQRVPATLYARQMFDEGLAMSEEIETVEDDVEQEEAEENADEVDFRNYVFSTEVIEDSTIELKDIDSFNPENNITEDGKYQPKEYRLRFSTDIAYSPSIMASTYGTNALTQFIISDLLGDHKISIGTNFVFDLRNSDYSFQYGYLKNRMNYFVSYSHRSRRYQTFYGEVLRYRNFGGSFNLQYPINKFKRLDFGFSIIGITQDYSSVTERYRGATVSQNRLENDKSLLLYPEFIFTSDNTLPGFLTPRGGRRYSIGVSSSPGVGDNAPLFASVLGDFRQYVNLGSNYSLAFRGSGAVSVGKDSQTYFMGGRLGWINQEFSNNGLSFDQLTDNLFTLPALPVRGYAYNSIYGNKFSLINAEFRFPLFAAVVPGAIPILPFYNMTGVAFLDVGTAWGQRINYGLKEAPDPNSANVVNEKGLDFLVAEQKTGYFEIPTEAGSEFFEASYIEGDILIGAGFGLRTILLGLPFRYDVGWPYDRTGFLDEPVHYFSIGIDF
ncbi:MAG: hypothetical protein FH748_00405 [Balneolaceae bacterium]|nr:hypothetical protein [Balneolaceae bacterium]